jgi:RHS repeat-associated protein
MARTAPAPNIPPIPGMCPGLVVAAGGGDAGGGSGKGPGGGSGEGGAGTNTGKTDAEGGGNAAPNVECTQEGHPVDVATGRMFTEALDFALRGVFPLVWQRAYTVSRCEEDAGLGFGWTHNHAWTIELRRDATVLVDDGGVAQLLPLVGPGERLEVPYGRVVTREGSVLRLETRRDGLVRTFVPDDADPRRYLLSRAEDRFGNRVELRRAGGRLTEIVDTVGRVVRLVWDDRGHVTAVEALNAPSQGRWVALARYRYSPEGDLVEAVDAEGHALRYRYEDHVLVAETNRVGLTFHFAYDVLSPRGRCTETWGSYDAGPDPAIDPDLPKAMKTHLGTVPIKGIYHRVFDYQPGGVTEVYDSRGGFRRYRANELGLVDKTVRAGGGVTSRTMDALGRTVAYVDADEGRWELRRDGEGRVVEERDPLGRTTKYEYEGAMREPARIVAANGGAWRFSRDLRGEVLAAEDPLGATTSFRVDERGLRVESLDPAGVRTVVRRDAQGNVIGLRDARGEAAFAYDYWGRLVAVRAADGREARFQYNDRGDLVAESDARGLVARYEYDGERNPVAVVRPDGTVTRARYGGMSWICEQTDAAGLRTRLLYDREGEIVAVENARGERFRFEYDRAGRVVGTTAFDGRVHRYSYSPGGKKTKLVDPDGKVTRYAHDAVGNLVEQAWADGTEDRYAYDELDFVVEAKNDDAKVFFERDLCGRVVRETIVSGKRSFDVRSTYDAAGRRTSVRIGDHSVDLERDATGGVAARVYDGARRQRLERDALGRVVATELGTGIRTERSYDPSGLLGGIRVLKPKPREVVDEGLALTERFDPVVWRSFEYGLDAELARVRDMATGDTTFAYDPIGRLVERAVGRTREAFTHDATSNVGKAGATTIVEPGDRLVASGDVALEWDDAGRLASKTRVDATGQRRTWRYAWHPSGCLASVTDPAGKTTRFAYDPFGRRTRKWTDGGAETIFGWDGNALAIEQRRASKDAAIDERVYLFEDGDPWTPVAQHAGGAWFDYVTTPIGTPTELVDDVGRVGWAATLTALGELEGERAPLTDTPLRFPGQYADDETGLAYGRMRYYDPELGRFVSPDPISIEGGLNLWAYARNPIGWADPLGLEDGWALHCRMQDAGIPRPTGHQAHHVIPEALYTGSNPHPLLANKDPHRARNGVYLPTYSDDRAHPGAAPNAALHRGSHPDYTERVRAELDDIQQNVPACQQAAAVAALQRRLRSELRGGHASLNNADPTRTRPASQPARVYPQPP